MRVFLTAILLFPAIVSAQLNQLPAEFENVDVVEKTGTMIPKDLVFATENGDSVTIGSLLQSGKPVILNPVYFECPLLCTLVLNGLTDGMREMDLEPGRDFIVITYSINPSETPDLAYKKKQSHLEMLGKPVDASGWHFLTGSKTSIDALTSATGFGYRWDEASQQYAHAASIMFLSPSGVLTRYLYGLEYSAFDLSKALNEAADGMIGSQIDRIMMFCYTYDPTLRSYVPHALNMMKIGGILTMIFLGGFLGIMWSKEKIFTKKPQIV